MQTQIRSSSIVAAFGLLGAALLSGCLSPTGQKGVGTSNPPLSAPSAPVATISVEQLYSSNIIGILGKPLGSKMIVDAVCEDRTMLAAPLHITKVDGRSLPSVVDIEPLGKDLKHGIHYKLEGYESGAFVGDPDWYQPTDQALYHYEPEFVVTRIIDPAGRQ